jgi:hypothetical protein
MKCPYEGEKDSKGESFPSEFSQWNDQCQECRQFNDCFKKFLNEDNEIEPSGDNHPVFDLSMINLFRNRQNMITKLLSDNIPKITQDDIEDVSLDIEIYNKQCRKQKIKDRYKKKEGK